MWISMHLILIVCAQTFFLPQSSQKEYTQSIAEESQHSLLRKTLRWAGKYFLLLVPLYLIPYTLYPYTLNLIPDMN